MTINRLKRAFNASQPPKTEINAVNYAARMGDLARVTAFLDEYTGAVDATADNGLTALMAAAANNMMPVVQLLLERGANPYEMTSAARTARKFAEREGYQDIAWVLRKAEMTFRKDALQTGRIPQKMINDYNYAARRGDVAAVTEFLSRFPYAIDAKADNGLTALMVAAANGRNSVIRLLLAHDADVRAVSPGGRTALGFAEREGQRTASALLAQRVPSVSGPTKKNIAPARA